MWHTVREIPEGTLVLRYHLASTLDFLEELQNRICPRGYTPHGESVVSSANTADRVVDLARREFASSRDRSPPINYRAAKNNTAGQKRPRDNSRDNSRDRDRHNHRQQTKGGNGWQGVVLVSSDEEGPRGGGGDRAPRGTPGMNAKSSRGDRFGY